MNGREAFSRRSGVERARKIRFLRFEQAVLGVGTAVSLAVCAALFTLASSGVGSLTLLGVASVVGLPAFSLLFMYSAVELQRTITAIKEGRVEEGGLAGVFA